MSDEIEARLRLDENLLKGDNSCPARIAVVEEQCDLGGFLLHHFIARTLRGKGRVVLISLENTLGHFHGAGLKFGVDIFKASSKAGSRQMVFVDGLEVVGESYLVEPTNDGSRADIISKLKTDVVKAVESLQGGLLVEGSLSSAEPVRRSNRLVIIVDKLSLLMSAGASFAATTAFLQWMQVQAAAAWGASLVVGTSGRSGRRRSRDSGSGPSQMGGPNDRLAAFLDATSHLTVAVWPLNTGFSEDVTGNLAFGWRGRAGERGDHGRYQFRIGDKDVKIFAPGTSRAVL